MIMYGRKNKIVCSAAAALLMLTGLVSAQDKVVELAFRQPPATGSDSSRTVQSIVKVQGTGGLCQDALYLITHVGDREDLFQKENQKAIDHPWLNDTWRFCSVYSTIADSTVIVGRNWDNQNVGSIIVSLYQPAGCCASISFCRAIDLGYPLNMDVEEIAASELGRKLLLAPFYAVDGINEHGLAVAVAGLRTSTHKNANGKPLIFITYLIRKILDQAENVEEAVKLAEKYVPFDLDRHSVNGHLLIADATGRSVILEYEQDQWRKIYPDKPWQVLTTKPIYNVPDTVLKEQCWRYRGISETLESKTGNVDWRGGMEILQDVAQQGTTWSEVFCLPTKELYFSVYQDWEIAYHLDFSSR